MENLLIQYGKKCLLRHSIWFFMVILSLYASVAKGENSMNDIETKIEHIFNNIPVWSFTIDPTRQMNYDGLKLSAQIFIDALPEIREQYKITKKSLQNLEAAGLPKSLISKLKLLDETNVYSFDKLSETLTATLGDGLKKKYETLIRRHTEIWREKLKEYSGQYCFPKIDHAKASALYLFLRVIFELPKEYPADNAKVYGGWIHPSIPSIDDEDLEYFDLSWPVMLTSDGKTAVIHSFVGYFGKGYDGIGEYDYFLENFSFRDSATLQNMTFSNH